MKVVLTIAALLIAQRLAAQADPRAKFFIERGCQECHAITGLGIKAATDVGPDLTFADVDVRRRYAMSLEQFLAAPVGPMRLVLAGHVRLSRTDADSIVTVLRRLNFKRLGELDVEPARPAPVSRSPKGRGT